MSHDPSNPRYMWLWFVYDGDESYPIRYSGPHYDGAKAAYLAHSNKAELPEGWHIWTGSRQVQDTIIIGSGMGTSRLTKGGKRRKPEPVITIIR